MRRNEPAQRPPVDGIDLTEFPFEAARGTTMYRAARRDRSAWWFASAPSDDPEAGGRFDLPEPDGTCYWADTVEVAVRERLAHHTLHTNTVFIERAREMVVAAARTPRGARFADVSAPTAVRFGVSSELATTPEYRVSQAWARAFHASTFRGVRYGARFSSDAGPNAWAIFGVAGAPARRRLERVHRSGVEACHEAGIRVIQGAGAARRDAFTVVPPPAD
jgi:hypothetical protein